MINHRKFAFKTIITLLAICLLMIWSYTPKTEYIKNGITGKCQKVVCYTFTSIILNRNGTVYQDMDKFHKLKGLTDIKDVDINNNSGAAVSKDGHLWIWSLCNQVPYKLRNVKDVIQAVGDYNRIIILKKDGSVWSLNVNNIDDISYNNLLPTRISGLKNIKHISNGLYYFLAIDSNKNVWEFGQLRLFRGLREVNKPHKIKNLTNIVKVYSSPMQAIAMQADGTIWRWGGRDKNPKKILVSKKINSFIALNRFETLFLYNNGDVMATGEFRDSGKKVQGLFSYIKSGINHIKDSALGLICKDTYQPDLKSIKYIGYDKCDLIGIGALRAIDTDGNIIKINR